jgi:hypothetical protein
MAFRYSIIYFNSGSVRMCTVLAGNVQHAIEQAIETGDLTMNE